MGLNTDRSVRSLKGEGRPIQPEEARAEVLASLQMVDAVIMFDDDTPQTLLKAVRPDVLIKGSEYRKRDFEEASLVKDWGGEVVFNPMIEKWSTTTLIERIQGKQPIDQRST